MCENRIASETNVCNASSIKFHISIESLHRMALEVDEEREKNGMFYYFS